MICISFSRLWDSLKSSLRLDKILNQYIYLPGYCFSSQPSNSNAGGVGFNINKELNYTIRSDPSSTTDEFEALQARSQKKFSNRGTIVKDTLELNFTIEFVVLKIANTALSIKYWTCKLSSFLIGL